MSNSPFTHACSFTHQSRSLHSRSPLVPSASWVVWSPPACLCSSDRSIRPVLLLLPLTCASAATDAFVRPPDSLNCGSRHYSRPLSTYPSPRPLLAMDDCHPPRRRVRRSKQRRFAAPSLALAVLVASIPVTLAQQCISLQGSSTCPAFSSASVSTSLSEQ
jgi:hypothetical protein